MTASTNESPQLAPLSVSELNRLARQALETRLPLLWVAGEISNLVRAASGHLYFTLKDDAAQVRCVMFRSRAQLIGWRPENGQHVAARALATLYEARGDFQLNIEALRQAGTGNLHEQFIRLRDRLDAEGLFAAASKRAIPRFPRVIGIVSSPQAAALRDVVTTLQRRAPQVRIVLYPSPVQGADAVREIVAALDRASARQECEVLLLCRGGGSLEDLWCFNDEGVARAIRRCRVPVIAGIGHETDTTIADFAADLRAPTPTAAAELAAPQRDELLAALAAQGARLERQMRQRLDAAQQRIDQATARLRHPSEILRQHRLGLGHVGARLRQLRQLPQLQRARLAVTGERLLRRQPDLAGRRAELAARAGSLANALRRSGELRRAQLSGLAARLASLDPEAVLARGYSVVTSLDGRILRDAATVAPGASIIVRLARGRLQARVEHADGAAGDMPAD